MDSKKRIEVEEDTKRLTFFVIFMSVLVTVLFGLGPSL